jgi:hypothetical protein
MAANFEWHTTWPLALEAIRQYVVDVMLDQVLRDGLDALLRFEEDGVGRVALIKRLCRFVSQSWNGSRLNFG